MKARPRAECHENETDLFPIDPVTGVLGTPLEFDDSQFQVPHACQGTDFWTHCRCGGSQEAQRRTAALWLHGFGDDNVARFLKADSDSEPDLLLLTADFDVSFRGMAWAPTCGRSRRGRTSSGAT
jgi:hypothetical protein